MAVPVTKQTLFHFRRRWLAVLLALLFLVPLAHTAHAVGSWTDGGDLHGARSYHSATLLASGQVLVAGGRTGTFAALASAELFNPTTGNWTVTGDMKIALDGHTATLLPNGKVLVAGGAGVQDPRSRHIIYLDTAQLYDPATGDWTATGSLGTARGSHTATLLPNGKVLVVGGDQFGYPGGSIASAELYDPATGTWTATGSLLTGRYGHTATLLPSGKVLVAGGNHYPPGEFAPTELYDPATGTWTATGAMTTPRYYHTATLLPGGKVLVVGGEGAAGYPASAELYDPVTGTWAATGSLSHDRYSHTATLLPTGKVLVTGQYARFSGTERSLTVTELYDPATGSWTDAGAMGSSRAHATATLLRDGEVLVAGGDGGEFYPYASTELYDPTVASAAPVIIDQPVNSTEAASSVGLNDSFGAVASGNPTPTVQWQVSTNNGGSFTNISGATATTYQFTLDLSLRGNQYRAVFTNSGGSVTTTAATLSFSCTSSRRGDIVEPLGDVLATGTPTFTWNGGDCVTQYYFYVGSSFGNTDLYSSGPIAGPPNSATVRSAIPLDGRAIYVRLWSFVYDTALTHGSWQAVDHTYHMASPACHPGNKADIFSPTGANIATGTPEFRWGGGTCISQYYLYVGSRFGIADLYSSGPLAGTASAATISPALPADGRTIYVALWSLVNGDWQAVYHDYTVGACPNPSKSDITSPAPGTIHGASQTFQWSMGACVTQHYLYIGSSYGGTDLYGGGPLSGFLLSMSVSGLPANGSTIYVRLWSLVNGTWQQVDHSYVTAP